MSPSSSSLCVSLRRCASPSYSRIPNFNRVTFMSQASDSRIARTDDIDVMKHKHTEVALDPAVDGESEQSREPPPTRPLRVATPDDHDERGPSPQQRVETRPPPLRAAFVEPPVPNTGLPDGDTAAASRPPSPVTEAQIDGMTVETSVAKRQRFQSLQMDVEHDAMTAIPFAISQETFPVPSACVDDALVDGRSQLWVPGKPLRIAYITWNLANKAPFIPDVAAFCVRPNAHIVVVGTQENGDYVGSSRGQKQWTEDLARDCLNGDYTVVSQTLMWALHLVVFARSRDVAQYVSHVHASSVKTATSGISGNKGGIAIGFSVSMAPRVHTAFEVVPSSPATRSPPHPLQPPASVPRQARHPALHAEEASASATLETHASDDGIRVTQHSDPHPLTHSDGGPLSSGEEAAQDGGSATVLHGTPPSHMTFLFINAHLAAHQEAVSDRNKGYTRIVARLKVGQHGKYAKVFKRLAKSASRGRVLKREHGLQRGSVMSAMESEARPQSSARGADANAYVQMRRATTEVDLYQLPHQMPSRAIADDADKHASSALHARDVTEAFDITFFGGDLNYRLNGTKAALEKIIDQHKDIRSVLMYNDQLNIERQRGRVFAGYREGQLLFRPTYKYDVKGNAVGDTYNAGKKQRLPAFCDRVLFKRSHQSSARKITLKLYTDVRPVRTSDHKPVVALFDVETEEYQWV